MGNCLTAPQVADGIGSPGDVTAVVSASGASGGPKAKPAAGPSTAATQQMAPATPLPPPAGLPKPDAMKLHQMKKRIAVAAEAISSAADMEIPVVPKTDYAERLIGARASHAARAACCLPCDVCWRGGDGGWGSQADRRCPLSVVGDALERLAPAVRRPPPLAAKAIEGCLLFEQLSLPAKQAIIRSMTPQAVRAGEVIIKQVCQP